MTSYFGIKLTSHPTAAPICAAFSLEVTRYGWLKNKTVHKRSPFAFDQFDNQLANEQRSGTINQGQDIVSFSDGSRTGWSKSLRYAS